jgi:hypothetical protein
LSQAFTGALLATGLFLLAALTAEQDQATRLLDATFERLPVGLVLLNPDLTLRRGSRNAEQLLGVQLAPGLAARTLVRRLPMTDLAGRPWLAEGTQMLAAARRSDASHGEVATIRYATGEPVRLEYWAVPVLDNGRLAALALLFQDVTELRRAEADRERLVGRLLGLQQDERRQLAVGLQREVVHGLAVSLTRLDGIQERLPDGEDRTRRSLGRAGEALNHSLQATRRLILGCARPCWTPRAWSPRSTSSSARSPWRPACKPTFAGAGTSAWTPRWRQPRSAPSRKPSPTWSSTPTPAGCWSPGKSRTTCWPWR